MGRLAFIACLQLAASGCLDGYSGVPQMQDAGTDDAAPNNNPDPVADFQNKLLPILVGADGISGACGACHAKALSGSPQFLAPPDALKSALAFPGIIGATPDMSRMYVKGTHEGRAFTDDEKMQVGAWIVEWNLFKPKAQDAGADKPIITPFTPSFTGPNLIDLSVLDPAFMGMKMTFDAKMVGNSIELSSINVKTPQTSGVHIVHPLFVMWDTQYNPTPDPVDSFSNLDETVPPSNTMALGPGTLLMPSFGTGWKLNIVFTTIEKKGVVMTGGDGGTVTFGCKDVAGFTQNATGPLSTNCTSCHGGANQTATSAFDLSKLASDAATACNNAKGEVNLMDPKMSALFRYPDPSSGITHPFKFAAGAETSFQTSVTLWINNEK